MENRIHMVLELEDGKKYMVINQAIYKNNSYLLVNQVNQEETDFLEEILILKEVKQGDKITVETVTDLSLLDLLAKYLTPKDQNS